MRLDKEQAIQAATDKADRDNPNWSNMAYEKVILILPMMPDRFQAFDVTEKIRVCMNLPTPENKRAWGGVFRRLKADGIIEIIGHKPTSNLTGHNAVAAIYKKV